MRALLAVVGMLVLFLMVAPGAAAAAYEQVVFVVSPVTSSGWDVTIPRTADVTIDVVLTSGGSLDLTLHGPGACDGANVALGPVTPGAPASVTVDCGVLSPTNTALSIDTLVGAGHGYLVLHGLHTS